MVSRLVVCFATACVLVSHVALAQEKFVGGGVTYNIDVSPDSFGVVAMGWIPVKGPNIPFTPIVLAPKFEKFFGDASLWQIDVDALWDIPMANAGNIHPYLGMGVGLSRVSYGDFGDNTPLLNFDAGLRFTRPTSKRQIALESHYSSGIDYGNTMVFNLVVLFPTGGR